MRKFLVALSTALQINKIYVNYFFSICYFCSYIATIQIALEIRAPSILQIIPIVSGQLLRPDLLQDVYTLAWEGLYTFLHLDSKGHQKNSTVGADLKSSSTSFPQHNIFNSVSS